MAKPKTESVFETPLDEAEEARLDARAEADIDAGKGVPHEQVRGWLARLGKGEKVAPPSV